MYVRVAEVAEVAAEVAVAAEQLPIQPPRFHTRVTPRVRRRDFLSAERRIIVPMLFALMLTRCRGQERAQRQVRTFAGMLRVISRPISLIQFREQIIPRGFIPTIYLVEHLDVQLQLREQQVVLR